MLESLRTTIKGRILLSPVLLSLVYPDDVSIRSSLFGFHESIHQINIINSTIDLTQVYKSRHFVNDLVENDTVFSQDAKKNSTIVVGIFTYK